MGISERKVLRVARLIETAVSADSFGGVQRAVSCTSDRTIKTNFLWGWSICRDVVADIAKPVGRAVSGQPIARPRLVFRPGSNSLMATTRLMQCARCQRIPRLRLPVSVAGVKRSSRLCLLMNPILPSSTIRGDLAGKLPF